MLKFLAFALALFVAVALSDDVKACCDSLVLESGGMGDFYQVESTKNLFSFSLQSQVNIV